MFIVILGGGIDLQGNLPKHACQRLDKAIEIFKQLTNYDLPSEALAKEGLQIADYQKNIKIVVSGKYSFLYNQLGKTPPTTEAEAMAKYLEKKSIPIDQILVENESQDTVSNAYYLKKNYFLTYKETKAIFISNKYHLPRVEYIFKKVFGPGYKFEFAGADQQLTPTEEKRLIDHQQELLDEIKIILSPMTDGDHHFLDGKFYTIDYYRKKRPDWVIKFVTQGK